jgi:hypothetical protein
MQMQLPLAALLLSCIGAALAQVSVPAGCERAFAATFEVLNSDDAAELSAAAACPDRNITATWQAAIVLQSTIKVAEGTTLTMTAGRRAGAIIDGNKTVQLFDVQGTLKLKGFTLQNGVAADGGDGGAIVAGEASRVIVENCVYMQHTAANGGCIYSEGAVGIANSVFKSNEAVGSGAAVYLSGANILGSVLVVLNTVFSENTATEGSIYTATNVLAVFQGVSCIHTHMFDCFESENCYHAVHSQPAHSLCNILPHCISTTAAFLFDCFGPLRM